MNHPFSCPVAQSTLRLVRLPHLIPANDTIFCFHFLFMYSACWIGVIPGHAGWRFVQLAVSRSISSPTSAGNGKEDSIPRTTIKAVPEALPEEDDVELKCIDSARSTANYSPPPLFANVPTTVTVEDIAAAAGESSSSFDRKDDRVDEVGQSCGNAEDFVMASKRKRRIEIPRSQQSAQIAQEGRAAAAAPSTNSTTMNPAEKDSYLKRFCAGGVEFVAKERNNGGDHTERQADEGGAQKCGSASPSINCNGREEQASIEDNPDDPKEDQHNRREVKSVAELVGGKMRFLSEGRPAVSGVQAMAIEFEVGSVLQSWRLNREFR